MVSLTFRSRVAAMANEYMPMPKLLETTTSSKASLASAHLPSHFMTLSRASPSTTSLMTSPHNSTNFSFVMLYRRFDDGSPEALIVLFRNISRSAEHDNLSQYDYGGGCRMSKW